MRSLPFLAVVAMVSLLTSEIASAAPPCPPEVNEAKTLLTAKTATSAKAREPSKSLAGARSQTCRPRAVRMSRLRVARMSSAPRSQDVQAPRSQDVQAPRSQDVQAPRSQDVQAPRSQDVQAPRSQDVQAPRSQDVQAPRSQDVQAPRNVAKGRSAALANARKLVNEAEAACKDADGQRATSERAGGDGAAEVPPIGDLRRERWRTTNRLTVLPGPSSRSAAIVRRWRRRGNRVTRVGSISDPRPSRSRRVRGST